MWILHIWSENIVNELSNLVQFETLHIISNAVDNSSKIYTSENTDKNYSGFLIKNIIQLEF